MKGVHVARWGHRVEEEEVEVLWSGKEGSAALMMVQHLTHALHVPVVLCSAYPSRLLEPSFSCTRELVSRRAESTHTHVHTHTRTYTHVHTHTHKHTKAHV